MDAPHALLAFTVAAGLAAMAPGLDTALVLRASAIDGPRRGMEAALGIALGCLSWGVAVSFGLGALLAVSRLAYDALRVAGALYMLWLGARMLAAAFAKSAKMPDIQAEAARPSWLLRGYLTNLLNPKVGVFYVTILPLFVPPHGDVVSFSLLLATIHAALGLTWFALLSGLMRSMARWIQRASVKRALDGLTGSVLIGFGLGLFLERR